MNVHWPIYFNSSDELVYNEEFHPFTMITNIQKRFDDWISFNNLMRRDRNIKISILSVMETTVLKLAHMFEKNLRQFKCIICDASYSHRFIRYHRYSAVMESTQDCDHITLGAT